MSVLVLSHVDRDWIKQRPHFLAEALHQSGMPVLFAFAHAFRRRALVRQRLACPTFRLLLVPPVLREKLSSIDRAVQRVISAVLARRLHPSVVIVTHPRLATLAMAVAAHEKAVLVYDCMDRVTLLAGGSAPDAPAEQELIRTSRLVTCSSERLLQDVSNVRRDAGAHLLRNALWGDRDWWGGPGAREGDRLSLGYVGTVSAWMDWSVVTAALESRPGWQLNIWGPSDVVPPDHDRLRWHGVARHTDLPQVFARCDVLVMPFLLNELVLAVDPVKAYEYVASGRGVVLPRYAETEHFLPLAQLYEAGDVGSFLTAVEEAARRRNERWRVNEFVQANSWERRASELRRLLDEVS